MNSDKFQKGKHAQLAKQDKSDKGHVDREISQLLRKINCKRDYYTTSSCAGRIVLIKAKEKKEEGLFLFRTHKSTSFNELKRELNKATEKYKKLIYFKQEPCITHVASSSLRKAQELVNKAKLAGWKKSGIIASAGRIICELRSTENIALPITMKKILVSDSFLKLLVLEANKKLAKTKKKIKRLEKIL